MLDLLPLHSEPGPEPGSEPGPQWDESLVSPVHDALQDGGEWRDADPGPDEDGVLRGEDLSGGSPVRSVYVTLTQNREQRV